MKSKKKKNLVMVILRELFLRDENKFYFNDVFSHKMLFEK